MTSFAKKGRPAMLTLVCGETDVGKSYRNRLEAAAYCQDNHVTKKKARKVLAFDTGDDDYTTYKSVDPDHIRSLNIAQPRRIRPYNKNGRLMTKAEKKAVVKNILNHYKEGLLLLDDIDDYMTHEKGQDMISALITLCHNGVDMIFSHQSIGKISKAAFQNCTWLRLHHQVDEATAYKDRIPNYALVRIAQLIVNEQYDKAYDTYSSGGINEIEFKIRSSYFVYVNLRKGRVKGCSKAAFVRATKRFIDQEEGRKVRMMLNETDFKGKKLYKDKSQVILKMISDYLRHYEQDNTGIY